MKKYLLSSALLIGTVAFIGCGDNGSDIDSANINYTQNNVFAYIPKNSVKYKEYIVKAVDDPIIGAKVLSKECSSFEENGNGIYTLKNCVSKPKYIVIEGGKIKNQNVTQNFPLILNTKYENNANNFVVTPLTTLVANADDNETKTISEKFGISVDDLFKDPKDVKEVNLTKINQQINAIFISSMLSGAISNRINFITAVRNQIEKIPIKNNDINVSKISTNITQISINKPKFFGLVFVDLNTSNKENVLQEVSKSQNQTKVKFLGLVFDKAIPYANVEVYRQDNPSLMDINTTANKYGKWTVSFDKNAVNMIKNENFIVIFKATDPNNPKIVLESSMSSNSLRVLLDKTRIVTPSFTPEAVISNVTTVENAFLEKRNAFTNVKTYENNKANIKVYYKDKLLKASAYLKDIVDNNKTSDISTNTLNNIINNTTDAQDLNLSNTVKDTNTTEYQSQIKSNPILANQLNYVPKTSELTLKSEENVTNGVYYRVLAYYNKNTFIREYQRIIMVPGNYQIKTCYLEGDSTGDWNCSIGKITENSNYSGNGDFSVMNENSSIDYSLDKNDSIYVKDLNKTYYLYEITKTVTLDNNSTVEPEVLVDNFDVIDMFRRMPSLDPNSFNNLKDLVKNKSRSEVNIEMNRYIKQNLDNVKKYFKNN